MSASSKNMSKIVSEELQKLLDKYGTFTVLEGREKIRCELSDHEMPCRVDALESYIKGKKFNKLLEKHHFQFEKQHLVPSSKRGRGHQLFCTLTLRHINNTPKHIQKHLEGRRFKKALARWEECQRTGKEFKPNRPRQRQNFSDTEMMSGEEDNVKGKEGPGDNLKDLYPAEDFDMSESDDLSGSDLENVKDERLKPSISQDDLSDSDYEFDSFENDMKPKTEGVSEKGDASVITEKGKKKKVKSGHIKKKKTKT